MTGPTVYIKDINHSLHSDVSKWLTRVTVSLWNMNQDMESAWVYSWYCIHFEMKDGNSEHTVWQFKPEANRRELDCWCRNSLKPSDKGPGWSSKPERELQRFTFILNFLFREFLTWTSEINTKPRSVIVKNIFNGKEETWTQTHQLFSSFPRHIQPTAKTTAKQVKISVNFFNFFVSSSWDSWFSWRNFSI